MMLSYPARLTQEQTGFLVEFIDLPDTFTEGATESETLYNAAEVLSAMLDWRMDAGQAIPLPSADIPDAYYVMPYADTQAALGAHMASHSSGRPERQERAAVRLG